MKNVSKLFAGAVLAFVSLDGFSQAQVQIKAESGVQVKKIEVQTQPTPIIQAAGVNDKRVPNQKTWIEMEVEFDIKDVAPRDAIVPELMVRYYLGLKDKDGQNVVLTGETTLLNVDSSDENFTAAYISPQQLYKLTERKNVNANEIVVNGVEFFYNGISVGFESSNNQKFWQSVAPQPGVLGRDQTPFSILWIDRYPDIKKK